MPVGSKRPWIFRGPAPLVRQPAPAWGILPAGLCWGGNQELSYLPRCGEGRVFLNQDPEPNSKLDCGLPASRGPQNPGCPGLSLPSPTLRALPSWPSP